MDFNNEKFISNFVENQFPQFYKEDGPNFILFVKAYYEWLETAGEFEGDGYGGPVREARELLTYRDIDGTIERFLEFFQKKYLYGIPFNIIANKRFLLKHILDVYRSKGTIQCYKLLFKLIYNEDVDIYLPSIDMLRVSDGTWRQPKYLEVTSNSRLVDYVGKVIVGTSSKTKAVVEDFVQEAIDKDVISILYLSNVLPRGGNFVVGEKLVLDGELESFSAIQSSPTLLGSLDSVDIISGGQDFNVGDIVKIAHRDPLTNELISHGIEGLMRVTAVGRGQGGLNFDIVSGGFGFTANSLNFVYRGLADTTGDGAGFNLFSVSNTYNIVYNTDIVCDYLSLPINSASYGFPANASANASSNIGTAFSYSNQVFGTITSLTNIRSGIDYTAPADIFIRSTMLSHKLSGNLTYSTASANVNGISTKFSEIFANGDVIYMQANVSLDTTGEQQIIRQVVNNTVLVLYGKPTHNSTPSAFYKAAPVILPAQFSIYEPTMNRVDGTINGINDRVTAVPSSGNNIVNKVKAINSGKAYAEGEYVQIYLYGAITTPTVKSIGSGYANGEVLVFSGGGTSAPALGYITTYPNSSINYATLTYAGSGYTSLPKISVKTKTGVGAVLNTTISEFNTYSQITGRVTKKSVGVGQGYWTTTRGFLNSDKYIQDSYYYQDYSYEVRVPLTLDKYKNILYNTFHVSGTELFGQFKLSDKIASNMSIVHEATTVVG